MLGLFSIYFIIEESCIFFKFYFSFFQTPMPGSETGEWAAPLFGYLLIFWIPIYYTLGLIV